MATDNSTTSTPAADKPTAPAATATATGEQGARRRPRRGDDVQKARIEVPGRPDVDGRLDNRMLDELQPVQVSNDPDAPKPQHVDGPDLAGQAELTAQVLAEKGR